MIMDKFWGFMTLFWERFNIALPIRVKKFVRKEHSLVELTWSPDEDEEKFKFAGTFDGMKAEREFENLVRFTNDYELLDANARQKFSIPVPSNVAFPIQLLCYLVRHDIDNICMDGENYSLRSAANRGVLYDWEEIPINNAYAVMGLYPKFGQAVELFETFRRGYEDFGYIDLRDRQRPFELEQFVKFCVLNDEDGVDPFPTLCGISSDDGLSPDSDK